MKAAGIIPARWASTRLAGKMLAEIDGKPMVLHVWERASKSAFLDEVIVACDDERIQRVVEEAGGRAVMTSVDHSSGTERVIEAAQYTDAEIIINIQGDEPLIDPGVIDSLVTAMRDDASCEMATIATPIKDLSTAADPNVVKVVLDQDSNALYFSRAPIPYDRDGLRPEGVYLKHLGIYAYRKTFLSVYAQMPPSKLEPIEKLEQLRVLEAGHKIKTVLTEHDSVSVDTPEDMKKVADLISQGKR